MLLAALLALPAAEARAEVSAGAGLRYFRWSEETTPIAVRESGPVFAVVLGLAQRSDGPVRFAYRGDGGLGVGDYQGSFLGSPRVPVSTTTLFATMAHEGQIRLRAPRELEIVGGLAFEWWHRQLGLREQEDYRTSSVDLAVERADRSPRGWSGGAGVRLPLGIREDAHFTDQGYDRDPILEPGKQAGFFGHARDRFTSHLALVGSAQVSRLGASSAVVLTMAGRPAATAFQPATTLLVLGIGMESSW